MLVRTIATSLLLIMAAPATVTVQPARFPTCRHDAQSSRADRERRRGAIEVARAVHAAQNRMLSTSRRFGSLAELGQVVPQPPEGFHLKVYASADGYVASLKDTMDPCHYGIFTDESGQVYEHTPDVPKVAR